MKLTYYKTLLSEPDPLTGMYECYRPMLPVELRINGIGVWLDALIDSGADYNLAPYELAEYFNLNLGNYPSRFLEGIEGREVRGYFVPATIMFGGHLIETRMGFGGDMDGIALGQQGFFDRVESVLLKYPEYVEVQPHLAI